MRKIFVSLLTVMLVLGLSISSHAALIDLGGGMIYSTDLDLTWLQDANYARTSGYSADGFMTWSEANSWATTLEYAGLTGWRLPTFDPVNPGQCSASSTSKLNEMLYLIKNELNNISYPFEDEPLFNCLSGDDYGLFTNVTQGNDEYWSGTTGILTQCDNSYEPPICINLDSAWYFWFGCG